MTAIAKGIYSNKRCKGQAHIDFEGYFFPNGNTSPTTFHLAGLTSITRLSAGLLQFAFQDGFADILSFGAAAMHATGLGFTFELDQTTTNTIANQGLITVRCLSAGSATDVTASTTNRIMCSFCFLTTGAGGNVG